MLYTKHFDIDPSPLSDRTGIISSPKNTSTDVNLIMCGRKSQETNGEKGINSSQLAAAQHLMLTLKLCQKKKKKSVSPSRRPFYFTQFQSFQTIQIYHSEVIMKRMIVGDWLSEHTDASSRVAFHILVFNVLLVLDNALCMCVFCMILKMQRFSSTNKKNVPPSNTEYY